MMKAKHHDFIKNLANDLQKPLLEHAGQFIEASDEFIQSYDAIDRVSKDSMGDGDEEIDTDKAILDCGVSQVMQ